MAPPTLSLKGRALRYLAAREHSRWELQRKLARHAEEDSEHDIERVLDELTAKGYLSVERFAQSIVHRKAPRLGAARLALELRQHGVDDELLKRTLSELQGSELTRARQVWQLRFGAPPADAKERARQIRFLQSRGFSSDAIRQLMRECEKQAPG